MHFHVVVPYSKKLNLIKWDHLAKKPLNSLRLYVCANATQMTALSFSSDRNLSIIINNKHSSMK